MRKLELSDVFKLSEMIDVMGIELDLNKMMDKTKNKEGDVQSKLGAEMALIFMKKMHKAEKLVYKFIADLTGETVQEVKKYSIKNITEFFTELTNDEGFTDFFTQA